MRRSLLSQLVAYLLQGLILGLRDIVVDEDQGEDTHDQVEGEDGREGEGVHQVQEGDRHQCVGRPVDSLAQTDGPSLQVEREKLCQEDPGDRTEADAVGRDVGDQGDEGDVGDIILDEELSSTSYPGCFVKLDGKIVRRDTTKVNFSDKING